MKKFKNQAAQGDVLIRRVAELPANATPQPDTSYHIISHSETGHHHSITAPPSVVQLFGSGNPLVSYMRVKSRPVELKHERSFDTHDTLELDEGIYEIRRQKEWAPEGWRRVMD